MPHTDVSKPAVIVIGAGPAGLAVAAQLGQRGVAVTVLERAGQVGASWFARYDRLRLNTSSWLSHLPGLRFPISDGRFPPRDRVGSYLERYAQHFNVRVHYHVEVERIEAKSSRCWNLHTSDGCHHASTVIVATGRDHTPIIPAWPGQDCFQGEIVHAANYRNALPYLGRRMLVVGPGNSGAEIALDLLEGGAADVKLSVRTPPHIVHRAIAGIPNDIFALLMQRLPVRLVDTISNAARKASIGDLSAYGLHTPPDGLLSTHQKTGAVPTFDSGALVKAIRSRQIEVVPAVEAFDAQNVLLVDGSSIAADAIIVATGYSTGLAPLVGHLAALDGRDRPIHTNPRTSTPIPGLHFIGFTDPFAGNLRQIRLDARDLAEHVANELTSPT
jgi:putative flavoprotein involved in K+ transport